MSKKKIKLSIVLLLLVVLNSCRTTQTSMIIGDNYNETKNQTTLTMFPYGNIVMPGKWTKTGYNQTSKQHFFKDNDSTTIAVAKNPKQKYPFYKSEQSNSDFLIEFTKWESDYFKSQGATVSIIENKSDKGYILWKATIESENINSFYLFGLKGDFAYNFFCDSKTWTEQRVQSFLIELFNSN